MGKSVNIIHPDHRDRADLAGMLSGESGVRTFDSTEAFLEAVSAGACGCVIAPSDLPGTGVRGLMDAMRARGIALPIVVLGQDADLPRAVEIVRAGAAEYLAPPVSAWRLRQVTRKALAEQLD